LEGFYEQETGRYNRVARIRELFEAVRDACAITVQGCSGMRMSELLGIVAGVDASTGLPSGVRLEDSITGQYEWFVIRTELSKTVEGGTRQVDWVLGMRPKGSDELPPAVRAIIVLNDLFKPWRAMAKTDRLFLSLHSGHTLPQMATELGPMTNDVCLRNMKSFLRNWVDLTHLPDEGPHGVMVHDLAAWKESKGSIFKSHMLRKSWAAFTLAVDPRLLPAIQMQFHHLSLAMTEGGYIGNNPLLVESLDSVGVQKRNLMLFEMVTGTAAVAGRMGEQLEEATQGLRREVAGLPPSASWKHVASWADANEIKLFFSAHATCCPTKVSEMRCNDAAGTPVWIRKEPNFAFREPTLCAGCACAVMDRSHQPFWAERYVSSVLAVRKAESLGITGQLRVIQERAIQAKKVLRKFGADIEGLDQEVGLKSKEGEKHAQIEA
jgi:hypothetical protein